MILGKITGKTTTNNFSFEATAEIKKFDYVQVMHKVYDFVLCQIVEIEKTNNSNLAKCIVVGYKDKNGKVMPIRIPFEPGTEILLAEDKFIEEIMELKDPEKGAYLGKLNGKNIDVKLDLSTLLTKHLAVLAKSGAGKSYTVGVLLEEIMDKKVPLLIIDPHGEYSKLKEANLDEKEKLEKFNLEPKSFKNIKEYGDVKLNYNVRPLKLNENLTAQEVMHLLPGKLSGTQTGILYNTIKSIEKINFANIIIALQSEENNAKWMIMNNLEYLHNLNLFSSSNTSYNELISPNNCSIINLRGIPPDVQEIIVYKLLKDLFELRKQNKVPPFFTVIEEAHNYCPERSFGETKCSKIIRNIASEGRKFGMGLCVVTQRPARVDKSVLSQCSTQIILKVTNPSDLKAISNSVEGITSESEDEIKNLPIGSALLTGSTDMPLFINVRPRMTKHGGDAVDLIETKSADFMEQMDLFEENEMLPIIKPKTSINDLKIMSDTPIKEIITILVPAYLFACKDKDAEFNILIEMIDGNVVTDVESFKTKKLPNLHGLSTPEIKLLKFAYSKKGFEKIDAIKSLGLEFEEVLNGLIQKGLIEETDNMIKLNENYIFSQLSNVACFYNPKFEEINYNEKKDKLKEIDSIKEELSRFTKIIDNQECYIAKYKLN